MSTRITNAAQHRSPLDAVKTTGERKLVKKWQVDTVSIRQAPDIKVTIHVDPETGRFYANYAGHGYVGAKNDVRYAIEHLIRRDFTIEWFDVIVVTDRSRGTNSAHTSYIEYRQIDALLRGDAVKQAYAVKIAPACVAFRWERLRLGRRTDDTLVEGRMPHNFTQDTTADVPGEPSGITDYRGRLPGQQSESAHTSSFVIHFSQQAAEGLVQLELRLKHAFLDLQRMRHVAVADPDAFVAQLVAITDSGHLITTVKED